VGLGWGFGAAIGAQYISTDPEVHSKQPRPNLLQQIQLEAKKLMLFNKPKKTEQQ
jgi:hypothetical protein